MPEGITNVKNNKIVQKLNNISEYNNNKYADN